MDDGHTETELGAAGGQASGQRGGRYAKGHKKLSQREEKNAQEAIYRHRRPEQRFLPTGQAEPNVI